MDQQKKRKKEQEKQKRERLVQSKADPFPSQSNISSLPPHFPSLKRSDGLSDELTRMTKNILGPYDACQEAIFQSMSRNQQQQLLGTFEATPSTPLHVIGNPFDRQFGRRSPETTPTTTATGPSTKGTFSSTAASTSSSSLASHHNRHSVAEAPGKGEDKSGGKPHGTNEHPRGDRGSHFSKSGRNPSESRTSSHKKLAARGGESHSDAVASRPSNVLPVRKEKKSRVRPFKSGPTSSPTANNQGFLLPKKPSSSTVPAASSQGAAELFKVESEQGSGAARSNTEGTTTSHGRTSTPPISSKKSQKLKKRHSHQLLMPVATASATPPAPPVTMPTADPSLGTLPSTGSPAPSLTMRKSNSVQSSGPLSSSSSSSTHHHKHRKQSTSSTGTTVTLHTSTLHTSTPHTSAATGKKHGAISSSISQPSLGSSSDKNAASLTLKTESTSHNPTQSSTTSHPPPPSSTGLAKVGDVSGDVVTRQRQPGEDKLTKKKKKKTKKEREKMQVVASSASQLSEKDKTFEKLKMKSENSEASLPSAEVNPSSCGLTQEQAKSAKSAKSLSGSSFSLLASGEPESKMVGKSERLSKQRPSNLTIDASGDNAEAVFPQESPMDIKDVQSLLKELMYTVSVPSPITPLSTPRRAGLFTFPQTAPVTGQMKLESISEAPPIGPTHQLSGTDSSGGESSSSESSSESSDDSDHDDEREGGKGQREVTDASLSMEEGEISAALGWEKVLPGMADSITPLKKTPPHMVANTPQLSSILPASFHLPTISPLAPDTPAHTQHTSTSLLPSPLHLGASDPTFPTIGKFVLGSNALHSDSHETPSGIASLTLSTFPTDAAVAPLTTSLNASLLPVFTNAHTAVSSLPSETHTTNSLVSAAVAPVTGLVSTAEDGSDNEGAESGSESDDESSDGEGDGDSSSSSGGEEDEEGIRKTNDYRPSLLKSGVTAKPTIGESGSLSSAPFSSGDDRFSFQGEGFFDFISKLQVDTEADLAVDGELGANNATAEPHFGEIENSSSEPQSIVSIEKEAAVEPMQVTVAQTNASVAFSSASDFTASNFTAETHPPVSTADMDTGTIQVSATTAGFSQTSTRQLSHQHSLDAATRGGKKRKLERQSSLGSAGSTTLQPAARKTPRIIGSILRRRDSSRSSFSISSESSSDSSDSSDDEQSDTEETKVTTNTEGHSSTNSNAQKQTLHSSASSFSSQNTAASASSLTQTANVPPLNHRGSVACLPQQRSLEAGELVEEEEEEEGEGEEREVGEWAGSETGRVESLWVKISLQKVDLQKEQKPKAKVEPYNVTAPSKRRRSTVDSSTHDDLSRIPATHHGVDHDVRSMYGRQRDRDDDHHGQYSRTDFHREDSRRHRTSGWERDPWSGGRHGSRGSRSHDRDRDHHRNRNWDEYGSYEDSRSRSRSHLLPSRNMSAEDYLREACKRKHEADRNRPPAIEKAKAYLESVAYFMRHGDAIERGSQCWDGTQTRSPFRLYMDTITLVKYCRSWASDCKQLVALCMRCMSVLYWKMFQLKQTSAANIQKDLQDFFIPSKSTQKSPYPGSLSPVPSPASVGSTTSTGSGVGGASLSSSQDPSPSSQVTVPKQIFAKASEHLTITGYLHQSIELWQQSNLIVEQHREFFATVDRRSSCRINQYSPIPTVADWLEVGAKLVHYRQ